MGHVQQSKTMIAMARQVIVAFFPLVCIRLRNDLQVAAELYDTTHFGSGVGFLIMSM